MNRFKEATLEVGREVCGTWGIKEGMKKKRVNGGMRKLGTYLKEIRNVSWCGTGRKERKIWRNIGE